MKKLAFFLHNFEVGGVEKVFITYANAIADKYEVFLIVLSEKGVLRDTVSPNVKIINLGTLRWRKSFLALVGGLTRKRFDYIVTGVYEATMLAYFAAILPFVKTKIIASKHNLYDDDNKKLNFVLRRCHRVFAVSNKIGQQLIQHDISEDRLAIIYNPIDIEGIKKKSNAEIGELPSKYIVFVGRLCPIKNIPLLLKAFSLFIKRNEDYKLMIVGDGILQKSLKVFAEKIGITSKVVWVGAVPNPYPYIKNADILVLPSFSEGLSLVVAEAMCLGTTIVSTPSRGPEELLQAPKYGYVTSGFKDPNDLCRVIEHAIEKPIDKSELQERSELFELEKTIGKFEALLAS